MKILLLLVLSIFLVSCGNEELKEPKEAKDVSVVEKADIISGIDAEQVIESKEFVNPNL